MGHPQNSMARCHGDLCSDVQAFLCTRLSQYISSCEWYLGTRSTHSGQLQMPWFPPHLKFPASSLAEAVFPPD